MNIRKIIIIIAIPIIFIIIILIGYFASRNKEQTEKIIEPISQKPINNPVPLTKKTNRGKQDEIDTSPISLPTNQKISYSPLFDQEMYYLDLDYPNLYVYDYNDFVVKIFNLEDETYKELYKIFDFQRAVLSPDKSKIIVQAGSDLNLLDLNTDKLFLLPSMVRKFVFSDKDLIVYVNDNKEISYLAYFRNGKTVKIRDLGILDPEIIFISNNKILLYQKNSRYPVFLLDLKSPTNLNLFLEADTNYSLLINKNQNLLFVSSENNSKIIDLNNKQTKFNFPWKTAKEKCSFDKFLICAVNYNFNFNSWYILGENFDEKIIVFDPEKNEIIKEIDLGGKIDVLIPKLVKDKIIFWNRLDSKIYSLNF